jgi:hypothetical protein
VPARLHWFADGSLFAYAVAANDAWAFHWRQIGARIAAFALASLPGEEWGRLTGDPAAGVALYGALLFLAPGLGLAICWHGDRTGRIRVWAALSTALLCPMVYGFPTEMWFAHAALWPALALLWVPSGWRWAAGTVALAVMVLSHEAGMVWAIALVAALALSPARQALGRGACALFLALLPWAACKALLPPDPYVAEVLGRNAWNLFAPASLGAPLLATMGIGLAALLAAFALCRRAGLATGLAAAVLAVWWFTAHPSLHGWDRYYLRTLLLGAVPCLALLAALHAGGRLPGLPARLVPAALGALAVVTLVHVVETARFTAAWLTYLADIRVLAVGEASDPALGGADFVSAARLQQRDAALAWRSTTPFLAVLASPGYAPRRLVVDPAAGYFWFDCATATANATAHRALPARTRTLVRRYACLHRRH